MFCVFVCMEACTPGTTYTSCTVKNRTPLSHGLPTVLATVIDDSLQDPAAFDCTDSVLAQRSGCLIFSRVDCPVHSALCTVTLQSTWKRPQSSADTIHSMPGRESICQTSLGTLRTALQTCSMSLLSPASSCACSSLSFPGDKNSLLLLWEALFLPPVHTSNLTKSKADAKLVPHPD